MFTPTSNSVSINIASLMKNNPNFESILAANTSTSVDMDHWETNTAALLNTLVLAQRERAELEERAKARFNQHMAALMGISPVPSLNPLQASECDIASAILRTQAALQLRELQQQQMISDRISSILYSEAPLASASNPAARLLSLSDPGNLAFTQINQQKKQLQSPLPECYKLRQGRMGAFPQVRSLFGRNRKICCITAYPFDDFCVSFYLMFLQKLHSMLLDLEESGHADVASFLPNKSGFIIRKPKEFAKDILPKYFKGISR
jgi:hypothetical protein